jgi:hypothetical protein
MEGSLVRSVRIFVWTLSKEVSPFPVSPALSSTYGVSDHSPRRMKLSRDAINNQADQNLRFGQYSNRHRISEDLLVLLVQLL